VRHLSFFLCLLAGSFFHQPDSNPVGIESGFYIGQDKLERKNLWFLRKNHKFKNDQCEIIRIEREYAVPFDCLNPRLQLDLPPLLKPGPLAIDLKVFINPGFKDQEFLISYSSSLANKHDTPRIISTHGLEKTKWTTLTIWLPNFYPTSRGQADLIFFPRIGSMIT